MSRLDCYSGDYSTSSQLGFKHGQQAGEKKMI